MDRNEAEKVLGAYLKARRAVAAIEAKILIVRTQAEGCTPNYGPQGGGGTGPHSKIENAVERIQGLKEDLDIKRCRANEAGRQVLEAIGELDSEREQKALRLKYIEGRYMWEIAHEIHTNTRNAQKLIAGAVEKL